ncbi:MAG TPA: YfhO family protein, partial [Pyrinomonadaceae bacterium]
VERVRRARSAFALCLAGGGAAYSMSVLNGHAQTFVYAGLLLAAYGLFLSLFPPAPDVSGGPDASADSAAAPLRDADDDSPRRAKAATPRHGDAVTPRGARRWRPLAVALGSLLVGAGLGAFQLFETARAARLSTRTALTYETFGEGSFRFSEAVRATLAPLHALADVTPYVAPLALLLAAVACVAAARPKETRDARVIFWAGVAVVAWLLMLGANTPLHGAVFRLPALNRFRVPSRHAFEWTFALSVLAAYGWDRLDAFFARRRALAETNGAETKRARTRVSLDNRATRNRAAFVVLLAAASAAGVFFWRAANLPPALGSRLDTGLGEGAYLGWKLAFTALLFAALGFAWRLRETRRRAFALAACVALGCFVEPNAFVWRKWGRLTLDAERFAARSPVTSLLLEDHRPEDGRVYTRVDLFVEEFTTRPRLEGPNLTALHGLHNVAGVEPLIPERYSLALGGVGPDSVNVRAGFPDNRAVLSERSRALDLLNTTHLVSFAGLRKSPDPPTPRDGVNFAPTDLAVTLAPGERAELSAAGSTADALAVVSSLANSVEEEQGTEVARIVLHAADGAAAEAALRAGADTSEWAHERTDVRAAVKHSLATVFDSAPGDGANSFRSHRYLARLSFGAPRRVARVEIVNTSRRASLALSKASLIDSAGGNSVPLYASPGRNWEAVYERDDALVLRNLRALPRAWLVARAEAVDGEEALKLIRGDAGARAFDPRRTVLLEGAAGELPVLARADDESRRTVESRPGAGAVNEGAANESSSDAMISNGSARVVAYEPAALAIETESARPAVLVVSENFYPGWEATVDGERAPIMRADYLLRAVAVPAGRHRVEMRYRPAAARRGALVSSLTLLALGVLTFIALMRRRPCPNGTAETLHA